MAKTIAEINDRISKGQAVVVTDEEIIDIVEEKGAEEAAREPVRFCPVVDPFGTNILIFSRLPA